VLSPKVPYRGWWWRNVKCSRTYRVSRTKIASIAEEGIAISRVSILKGLAVLPASDTRVAMKQALNAAQ
jgi:hypothetical protein